MVKLVHGGEAIKALMVSTQTIEVEPGESAENATFRIIGPEIKLIFIRPLFNLNPDLHGDRFNVGYKKEEELNL